MDKIEIHLCENNTQGEPCGKVSAIAVYVDGELAAMLEPVHWPYPVQIKTLNIAIIVKGIVFPTKDLGSRKEWSGTMRWNGYTLAPCYGLGLLQCLKNSRLWHCVSGWSAIFERFNEGGDIIAADLELSEDYIPRAIDPKQMLIPFCFNHIVNEE